MLISTLNCEMWPNFSYRGVRSVQLLLLLLLLMVFSLENFGFSPPYAGIAGIGPVFKDLKPMLTRGGIPQDIEYFKIPRADRVKSIRLVN